MVKEKVEITSESLPAIYVYYWKIGFRKTPNRDRMDGHYIYYVEGIQIYELKKANLFKPGSIAEKS